MLKSSLFEGERVHLLPLSPELDAPIIASWTFDLEFARFFRDGHFPRSVERRTVELLFHKGKKS